MGAHFVGPKFNDNHTLNITLTFAMGFWPMLLSLLLALPNSRVTRLYSPFLSLTGWAAWVASAKVVQGSLSTDFGLSRVSQQQKYELTLPGGAKLPVSGGISLRSKCLRGGRQPRISAIAPWPIWPVEPAATEFVKSAHAERGIETSNRDLFCFSFCGGWFSSVQATTFSVPMLASRRPGIEVGLFAWPPIAQFTLPLHHQLTEYWRVFG